MSDKSTQWLQNAITDGLVEWFATRASEGIPKPDELERAIYRVGFAAGADAALTHCSEVLTREDD